jgi:hypothetical protein
MADTIKKTKTPAKPKTTETKPRKAPTKKAATAQPSRPAMPPREEIERLAREYWAQRGYVDGYAEQDWLRAEQELLQMAS